MVDPARRLTIGLVTADIHLGVGSTLWSGVLDAAERHDVNLICFPGGEVHATNRPRNAVYDLVTPDLLDGLICWASTLGLPVGHARATRLTHRFERLPMVSLNGALGADHPLTLDGYRGVSIAISHLIEVHQRRRLAFVRGSVANPITMERFRAYTDTLARYRIPFDQTLVSSPVDFQREAGASAMRVLLDARALRPGQDFDAVVASSDLLAIDALRLLSDRGVDVPADVAVVGVNDSLEARLADPPLTSVTMPFAELGELAVETLLSRLGGAAPMDGGADRPAPASTLVARRSCGCPGTLTTPAGSQLPDPGAERLPERPRAELRAAFRTWEAGADADFLREVDRLVGTWATSSHQTDAWDAALLAMYGQQLGERDQRIPADPVLDRARLIVADAGRRLLDHERWQTEHTSRQLRELGNTLSSVVDVHALAGVLDQRLPELGVPHWRLALEQSIAWTDGALPADHRYDLVVEPLCARDEPLGFGLFETGPRDGGVYRALGDQISATLEEIRLFQEVLDARDAAQQANRVKTTLLSSVSDELRAPVEEILRHVASALEAVQPLGEAPDGLLDSLKEINVSAEHQLGVICDLLDLSRAEIDTLQLSIRLIDPRELLEEVFRTRLPGRLPLIPADRRRLRQALVTLQGSANRLIAGAGRVTVQAEAVPPHLLIRVSCEGCAGTGTGLELPITRRLITLHEGSLRFEAARDGGTFHIALPLPAPGGVPVAGSADCLFAVGAAGEASGIGSREGLPVRRPHAGEDIAVILEDVRPAAVLWDLADLGTDTWVVTRQLHDHPLLRRTPFLVYGADSSSETDWSHEAGHGRDLAELITVVRPAESAGPMLLADADPTTRALYQRLLTQLRPGHVVLAAPDGTTALSLLGEDVPSLLVLAQPLPDMAAFDVLDRLSGDARSQDQDVPAVVLGDTVAADDVQRAEPYRCAVLLGKGILSDTETVELLARLLGPRTGALNRSGLLVKHALAYLHQHYQHPITRRQVARAAGMSEDYLSRTFHRELGLSPWEYLNRLRVQRAKQLLRESDDSVQVVARRVGFHDRAYFSRTFRKLTGVPPQAFREAIG